MSKLAALTRGVCGGAGTRMTILAGQRFTIVQQNHWFQRDFIVTEATDRFVVVENSVERYSVTRLRFEACWEQRVFTEVDA